MAATYLDFAKMFDHSLLMPTLTESELEAGIDLALAFDVASVCIMPYYLPRLVERLRGSTVKASTVIAFPHGGAAMSSKLSETINALGDGCEEVDFVINISQAKSGEWEYVGDEIEAATQLVHDAGQRIKVIFENAYLNDAQKVRLCEICGELGVDWVKTSTGYAPTGATFEDLELMRKHSPATVQVKAAGGMRDYAAVLRCREIGVSRIGSSKSGDILNEARRALGLDEIAVEGNATSGY